MSFNQRSRGGYSSRAIKSFDPSHFIKRMAAAPVVVETTPQIPAQSFEMFQFDPRLIKNVLLKGYTQTTPIQTQAMPLLMAGKDVVGLANTGTGKTAAFLLPMMQKISKNMKDRVLIVAPTRELAMQIYDEFRFLVRGMGIYGALCIGGTSMHGQIYELRKRPQFVIGTPGRLKDLQQQGVLQLNTFTNVVLDEVDRMFDMGFIHDVTQILSCLPANRQSAFFSATTNPNVERTMQRFMKNPEIVSVVKAATTNHIAQDVVYTKGRQKIDVLHDLLIQKDFEKVLVFGRTKWGLEKLTKDLERRGFQVAVIHGNKTQGQRSRALDHFKTNRVRILLATDVASRGLDIDNVTHVINYDLPESQEDYIHRIGRTGRANKSGVALTLV